MAEFTSRIELNDRSLSGITIDDDPIRAGSGDDAARPNGVDGARFEDRIVATQTSVAARDEVSAISGAPDAIDLARPSTVQASAFTASLDLASLDGRNGFRIDGIDAFDRSGVSVASAGDVNGDGFDDLVIGANGADPGGDSYAGESYVVFGKAGGFAASFGLASLDGSNGFRIDGIDTSDNSGRSVSSAGDVNGDGFDDIIIGSSGADPGGDSYAGESYVVFGKADGFTASFDLATLDGGNGFRIDGIDALDSSGYSVSSAGDVNGDGFDDIIIGAGFADPGGDSFAGESYVVFGSGSGFAPSLDLASLDGSNGFRIDGIDTSDQSGRSVSAAGDVNGDGFDDIIIGAFGANPAYDSYAGESYVVFGKKAGGFAPSLDLASLDGSNGFRLDGIDADDRSGRSVSSAGDVNGDGFGDIVIGAVGADPGGESYVVFGHAGAFDASLDLASLDGSNGFRLDGIDASDQSGVSVAAAGDVNGDGFDDIVIGANGGDPGGDSNAGESYVVFGKAGGFDASFDLGALDGANGFRLDGIDASDRSGSSVSSAGDVDGDGFDDIVIAAYRANSYAGESYVVFGAGPGDFPAVLSLDGLGAASGSVFYGVDDYDQLGRTLASAGDVNGDGFDDVILGAARAAPYGEDDQGASYVVFGSAAGFAPIVELADLDGTDGFRIVGVAESDSSGQSVSSAGDINGDGFGDVIVGAYGADPGGADGAGSSYVIFGAAGGFDASIDLASLDGNNGFRLDGAAEYDNSGTSVASAGDVNGDGLDDLIIGATGVDPDGRNSAGASYIVFGSDAGFDASLVLDTLDGSNGFRVDGFAVSDNSGESVASAGDVNGDGFDDIVIGARDAYDDSGPYAGATYVVFGSDAGFAPSIDLADLDGTNGFRLDGVDTYDSSGISVASAGDFNGDGFDDVIIGARDADPSGRSYAGESYIVFGSDAGFAAEIDLADLDGADGFAIPGLADYDSSGRSVSSAGDVNGDGFDDVIIGAAEAAPGGVEQAGSSYVVFGSAGGFTAEFDLATLDGTNGFRIDGAREDDSSGYSVSAAGDVDGDGFDDILVGSDGDGSAVRAGEAYVIYGRAPTTAVARIGSAADQAILGGDFNDTLNGKLGDDSLVGGLGDDVLRGTAGEDTMVGGEGDDMYFVDSAGDVVIETAGQGTDMVIARTDFSAGANEVELIRSESASGLALTGGDNATKIRGGAGADTLTGGAAGDVITGAGGDDRIVASGGNDFTRGGGGADSFVLSSEVNGADRVRIADFTSGTDVIELDADDFGGGLTPGALDPDAFVANATGSAEDAEDRLLYNTFSGVLSFDADGTGDGEAIDIARLMRGPELDAGDFLVTGSAADARGFDTASAPMIADLGRLDLPEAMMFMNQLP